MIRQEEVYKIGKLGKTHGVKGELSFLFDDDVFDRVDADYLVLDLDGILVPFFIEEYRFRSDSNVILKLEGVIFLYIVRFEFDSSLGACFSIEQSHPNLP